MKKVLLSLAVVVTVLLTSCGPKLEVKRVDTNEVADVSGRWNDVDAQMVSKEMVNQMFEGGWLNKFKAENGRDPVLIVGRVGNKTSEHINTEVFTKEIEKACINSGLVEFVASSSERDEIRQERVEQQSNASMETTKQIGNETGADFMLKGVVSSIEDAIDGKKVVFYQTNMELVNIETNKKVWVGDKKIKKFVSRGKWKP
ncbi:MAG: penicillin-binding protein activator LpoB [Flavobacteriales bacterium]|nr:penicillin-binding protein activator LpoB [Flavobacteriales bacterium]